MEWFSKYIINYYNMFFTTKYEVCLDFSLEVACAVLG